jgi:hypothetical protein
MADDGFDIGDLGDVISGITDVLYGLCRQMQLMGVERDQLVQLMGALISDARLLKKGPKHTMVAEAVKGALLKWDDRPPDPRSRFTLIGGDLAPSDDAA